MTSFDFKAASETFARIDPRLWRLLYPRFFDPVPGKYLSPRAVSAILFANVWAYMGCFAENLPVADGVRVAFNTSSFLSLHRMPTYFVAEDLMDALIQSDLPDNLRWQDIHLPMPCATFMLPIGKLNHANEGSLGFISYACYREGITYREPITERTTSAKWDTFTVISATHLVEVPPLYHMVLTREAPYISHRQIHDSFSQWPQQEEGTFALPTDQADRDLQERMTAMVFRLIMAMQAKPDLISTGQFKGKRLKSGTEIWTPHFIGKNYHYQRHPGATGTGISPRMHWRRGHLRQQPHGPKMSLRKTIWIEPMLVNAETEE